MDNRYIAGIIVTILLVGAILFATSTTVRFSLNDELSLQVQPLDLNFTANTEPITARITVFNENFAECNTVCKATLTQGNTTIGEVEKRLEHKEESTFSFRIPQREHKVARTIYQAEFTCNNIKSVVCRTSEFPRKTVVPIIVTDILTESDQELLVKREEQLNNYLADLNRAQAIANTTQRWMQNLPQSFESDDIKAAHQENLRAIDQNVKLLPELLRSWERYDLTAAVPLFKISQFMDVQDAARDLMLLRNQNIDRIHTTANYYNTLTTLPQTTQLQDAQLILTRLDGDVALLKRKVPEEALGNRLEEHMLDMFALLASSEQLAQDALQVTNREIQAMSKKTRIVYPLLESLTCTNVTNTHEHMLELNENATKQKQILNITNDKEINQTATVIYSEIDNTPINITFTLSDAIRYDLAPLNTSALEFYINACQHTPKNLSYNLSKANLSTPTTIKEAPKVWPPKPLCCTDTCSSCTTRTPIVFIHGHAFNDANRPEYSMSSFTELQEQLEQHGYFNAGELNLAITEPNVWANLSKPPTIRSSFYFINHFSLGGRTVSTQKSERIENYALRLKEVIDEVKLRTGSDQIILVAHSMGGLVAREYTNLFPRGDIKTLITVNTPHYGISERIAGWCRVLGADKECEDMTKGSVFLSRLNTRRSNTPIISIASSGCKMEEGDGDGIVLTEDALLQDTQQHIIKGSCKETASLHTNVLLPNEHPEILDIILAAT